MPSITNVTQQENFSYFGNAATGTRKADMLYNLCASSVLLHALHTNQVASRRLFACFVVRTD